MRYDPLFVISYFFAILHYVWEMFFSSKTECIGSVSKLVVKIVGLGATRKIQLHMFRMEISRILWVHSSQWSLCFTVRLDPQRNNCVWMLSNINRHTWLLKHSQLHTNEDQDVKSFERLLDWSVIITNSAKSVWPFYVYHKWCCPWKRHV